MEIVSIIIPIYNAGNYIASCLDSILKQTYQCFEVILIDDGSNDLSGLICDNYAEKDERITAYHRENSGVSASRNFGIEHANGKYILFVDADDSIESDMLEGCVQLAENNKAELVICSFRYHFMKNNQVVENSIGRDFCGTENELFDEWFTVLVDKEILNPPWNKFMRKDLLDNNCIRFHEKYSICEDMAFSTQIIAASKKTVLTGEMYYNYYLKSSGSLIFKFNDNYFEALTYFYRIVNEYCKKFKNNKKQLNIINTLYVNLVIMFIKQINTKSHWDKKLRYAKMREIGKHEEFLHALKNVSLNGKKRLVCYFLQNERYFLITIIYKFKNIQIKKR